MGSSRRARLIDMAVRHARRPDPARLKATGPECDYIPCSVAFTPARPHQRFCRDAHRLAAWAHPELDRKANGARRATKGAAS